MKTKIGISAGLIGSVAMALALAVSASYISIIALVLVAGYVLLKEQNDWLKYSVTKALVLAIVYIAIVETCELIPTLMNGIGYLLNTFNVGFGAKSNINGFFYFVEYCFKTTYMVFTLLMVIMACKMKSINVGPVDGIVKKHLLSMTPAAPAAPAAPAPVAPAPVQQAPQNNNVQ